MKFSNSLNAQFVRTMAAVTLVALTIFVLGLIIYDEYVQDLLYPDEASDSDEPTLGDFIAIAVLGATGVTMAGVTGWWLARQVIVPLDAVAKAARAVAEGDLAARAEVIGRGFGEAQQLVADFNAMANRLERAEAERQFSNSAIAHELRTPLTVLRGRLQGLADGVFVADGTTYSGLIAHVEDLSRLVEDLRTLGLFTAGRLDLRPAPLDLAVATASVIDFLEPDLTTAGIAVERVLGRVTVNVDGARVRQAVLALMDNARRYAGGGPVKVETGTTYDHGFIRVSDAGPGLPEGAEALVFERFWRADPSRSRAGGGTGLGLPVVRAIARAHGGEAAVRPRKGGGLVVEITLPLAGEGRLGT